MIHTLHVLPGPIYEPKARLEKKYAAMSSFSCGLVITLGVEDAEYVFGNYKVIIVGTNHKYGMKEDIRLFLASLKHGRKYKKASGLDIVVCYDPLKTGIIGFLLKNILGSKLIVEINGVYDSPILYRTRGVVQRLKRLIYPFIQRFIIRKADALKCLFRGQLGRLISKTPGPIYYFFDFTDIRHANQISVEQKKILTIGHPVYIKGIDLLIKAFHEIKDRSPGWTLEIVGHFYPPEKLQLSSLIDEEARIMVRKPVDFVKIPELLDSCEIFVLASRSEAMGRVLLEAMARGKPRLAANVDGIPSVVADGKDGLLFAPESVPDLAGKLLQMIGSPETRRALGQAGLNRYLNEFTVDRYAVYVRSMYESVLNGKQNGKQNSQLLSRS